MGPKHRSRDVDLKRPDWDWCDRRDDVSWRQASVILHHCLRATAIARVPSIAVAAFKSANLTFSLDASDAGTRITHEIHLRVRPWLFLLLPVLRLIGRRALSTDLDFLRRSLEEGLDLTRLAT
jgi:hypothetical protein